MKLSIEIERRDEWLTARVEDEEGNLLGEDTAPLTEGATFDTHAAVVRSALEDALPTFRARREQALL